MSMVSCVSIPRTLLTASLGSVVSAAFLAASARQRGKGALQPVNATSHWLHGEAAASVTRADWPHTGVGFATHAAATLFWAGSFELWLAARRRGVAGTIGGAVLVSAVAAVVDYAATPKRFTPGWEFVLPPRWMASAYVGMAAGFVLGARVARPDGAAR